MAFGRYTGTYRETGDRLDAQSVHHWSIEDGEVTAFQHYPDTAQWSRIYGR